MVWLLVAVASAGEVAERKAYERAVAAATDELKLYDGWYTALLVRGTLVTPALREAQAERVAHLTDGAAAGAPPPDGVEVWLSASTQFPAELTFAADGSTPWTVSLSARGNRCAAPTEVVEVKKPSERERTLYPHITSWDKVFRLRWAADACAGAEPDQLRFHGRRGEGVLQWR